MPHRRRGDKREHGQILVIFALSLVVILAFASLVVDISVLRNDRATLVNTMDAAALAAGTVLPVDGSVSASPSGQLAAANALIDKVVQANYPGGLALGTGYTITYKCLIGVTATNTPRMTDVPTVCNPTSGVGHTPVASDFTGAGSTRVANCNPAGGDLCNTVLVTGNANTPFSFGRVVGVNQGNTGAVQAASCNGPCGASPVLPVDVVLIMDRTASMSDAAVGFIQAGASSVLSVFNPALQRIALGTIGPSTPGLAACPNNSHVTSPLKSLSSPANQVYGTAMTGGSSNINFFTYPTDLPKWIPVDFTGTDSATPAVTWNEAYSTNGVTNTNSRIWKAISCLYSYTTGTNLDTPVYMAQQYLNTYGRPGVKKGIILETDGSPEAGDGSSHYTCQGASTTATTAKAAPNNIEIFTIYYPDGAPNCPDSSGTWKNAAPTALLQNMASANGPGQQHYFNAPTQAALLAAFTQAAVSLAKGTGALVQLYPTPVVTALSTNTGPKTGGTSVTITGSYFTGATSVMFGGGSATSFSVVNDTTITAVSPVGSANAIVNIVVTTGGGYSPQVAADRFTYGP